MTFGVFRLANETSFNTINTNPYSKRFILYILFAKFDANTISITLWQIEQTRDRHSHYVKEIVIPRESEALIAITPWQASRGLPTAMGMTLLFMLLT